MACFLLAAAAAAQAAFLGCWLKALKMMPPLLFLPNSCLAALHRPSAAAQAPPPGLQPRLLSLKQAHTAREPGPHLAYQAQTPPDQQSHLERVLFLGSEQEARLARRSARDQDRQQGRGQHCPLAFRYWEGRGYLLAQQRHPLLQTPLSRAQEHRAQQPPLLASGGQPRRPKPNQQAKHLQLPLRRRLESLRRLHLGPLCRWLVVSPSTQARQPHQAHQPGSRVGHQPMQRSDRPMVPHQPRD